MKCVFYVGCFSTFFHTTWKPIGQGTPVLWNCTDVPRVARFRSKVVRCFVILWVMIRIKVSLNHPRLCWGSPGNLLSDPTVFSYHLSFEVVIIWWPLTKKLLKNHQPLVLYFYAWTEDPPPSPHSTPLLTICGHQRTVCMIKGLCLRIKTAVFWQLMPVKYA